MKTIKKLVELKDALTDAVLKYMDAVNELETAKATIVLGDEKYSELKNAEQRNAYLLVKLQRKYDNVAELAKNKLIAQTDHDKAELLYKEERNEMLKGLATANL